MTGITAGMASVAIVSSGTQLGTALVVAEATSVFAWVVMGVVVVAKTGIDYKKYKEGKMTKK